MVSLEKRIAAFEKLGLEFENAFNNPFSALGQLAETVHAHNGWFTPQNVKFAYKQWAEALSKENLIAWVSAYDLNPAISKSVGLIMAGNIPMVGLHDLISVLISGNRAQVKLSSKDTVLMRKVIALLLEIEPAFAEYITVEEHIMKGFDAVIATGSNNTSRYFDYYFGKYPHIIRQNRTSIAILTGKETVEELRNLGWDIFRYFGLGCRSVTKIFVPKGYDFTQFFESLNPFAFVLENNKYVNNYDYNKSIFLLNRTPHLDNGFLLLQENTGLFTPAAMLYYEEYESLAAAKENLEASKDQIQCVVSIAKEIENSLLPGDSQSPTLIDYADGVDTLKFLIGLTK